MKHWAGCVLIVGFGLPLSGCDALTEILLPNSVTVSLVNDSDFAVDVTIFYDDEQDTIGSLLTEIGTELEFTISSGDTLTFSRDCDDLQAIVIEDADLLVVGGIGPETNSDVLRDGHDFNCGDEIVFTFSHSDLILDFDITTQIGAGR